MNVLAYLDPASGSLIAATVAGGLAGVGVAAKSAWHRRTSRFRKSEEGATDGDATTTDEDTASETQFARSDES